MPRTYSAWHAPPSQVVTVTFNGQLTEFQVAEDTVRGGHPKTTAVINDVAEILLGLFVPWDHLTNLFRRYATKRDACVQVWAAVEPTLAYHSRGFARNIELLRKSKEDCQADAKMWKSANDTADSFRNDVDIFEPATFGSDGEEGDKFFHLQDENFNAETLIATYHSISKAWHRETVVTARQIRPLIRAITHRSLPLQNFSRSGPSRYNCPVSDAFSQSENSIETLVLTPPSPAGEGEPFISNSNTRRYKLRPNRPSTFPPRKPRYLVDRHRSPHFFRSYRHSLELHGLLDRDYTPSRTPTPSSSDRSLSIVSSLPSAASSLELFGLEVRSFHSSDRESVTSDRRNDISSPKFFSSEERPLST